MDRKYNFVVGTNAIGLHRIVALRDIPRHSVKKGDLGGFVESEKNLSQEGDAWVSGNAWVRENACVSGNALVCEDAQISGDALVSGFSRISGYAQISENARISGNSKIYEAAQIYGNAKVSENAHIYGNAQVYDNAQVFGNARIFDNARVSEHALIYGDSEVSSDARVYGQARVSGNAKVYADAIVHDKAWVCGNAKVRAYVRDRSVLFKDLTYANDYFSDGFRVIDFCKHSKAATTSPCDNVNCNTENTTNKEETSDSFGKFISNLLFLDLTDGKALRNIFKKFFGRA